MGGDGLKHWTHVSWWQIRNKHFLILSPLLYTISSLLSSLCSPSCLRTHPTLTPEKLNSPTSHNSHPTSNNSLLCTWVFRSHPPLITLNRSPTSHNSHQTNNFLLCTLISKGPKPKYTKEITRPTSISLTHLTPHGSSLINPNSGFKRVKIPHDLSPITPIKLFHPFLPINSSPTKLYC